MEESRLTFSQKTGFQSILRDGKSLPKKSSSIMQKLRSDFYSERNAAKARQMGMQVMSKKQSDPWKETNRNDVRIKKKHNLLTIIFTAKC